MPASDGNGKRLTTPATLIFDALNVDSIPDVKIQFHKMAPHEDPINTPPQPLHRSCRYKGRQIVRDKSSA